MTRTEIAETIGKQKYEISQVFLFDKDICDFIQKNIFKINKFKILYDLLPNTYEIYYYLSKSININTINDYNKIIKKCKRK